MESRAHVLLALLLLPTAAPAVVALNARAPPPLSRLSTSHSSAEVPLPPTAELTTLVINEEQTLVPSAAHGAMPFVSIDASNQTLNIHPAALHALASAPAPICVLSIAGGAQEGKSAWLNMFSHWLLERWPTVGATDAGAPFKVGRSIFDDDGSDGRVNDLSVNDLSAFAPSGTASERGGSSERGDGGAGGGDGDSDAPAFLLELEQELRYSVGREQDAATYARMDCLPH